MRHDLNPCHVVSSNRNNGLDRHANHSAKKNKQNVAVIKASGAICSDFETDYPTSVSLLILSRSCILKVKNTIDF
jgi:hypothetical protein